MYPFIVGRCGIERFPVLVLWPEVRNRPVSSILSRSQWPAPLTTAQRPLEQPVAEPVFTLPAAEANLRGALDELPIPKLVGRMAQPFVRGAARRQIGQNAQRSADIVRATAALGEVIPPVPTGTLDLRALTPGLGNNDGVRIIVNGGNPLLPPYVDDRSY